MMARSGIGSSIAGALALAVALATMGAASSQEVKSAVKYGDMSTVTQDLLNRAESDGNNFLHTNGNYEQTRFYPNAQINRGNVAHLHPAWIFPDRGQGIARDLADRRQRRHVRHHLVQPCLCARRARPARRSGTTSTSSARSRPSAAARTTAASPSMRTRSIVGTLDAKLVALDAKTGNVVWETDSRRSREGLQRDDGADRRRRQNPDRHQRRRIRHPRLRQGLRRQGRQAHLELRHHPRELRRRVGDEGRHRAATCIATSRPRRRRWRRTATPTRRSAAACGRTRRSISATKRIYFVVGNPSPDLDGAVRPGDNLYTNSLVSLDLDTGKYVCHFQYIAHDVWDLDAVSPTVLVNAADKYGKMIPARPARRQDRLRLRARSQGLQPHPLLRPDGGAEGPVDAADADQTARSERARCSRAPTAASNGRRSRPIRTSALAYAINLHQPMTYHGRQRPLSGRQAVARRRVHDHPGRGAASATSPRSTTTPARSPGRSRRRSR